MIKIGDAKWIFDHQAYFIKASIFTDVIKGKDWFRQSISERTFKCLALKKYVHHGERISVKKDRNNWEMAALMVRIIAKEKNGNKVSLTVYFHFRFSIA